MPGGSQLMVEAAVGNCSGGRIARERQQRPKPMGERPLRGQIRKQSMSDVSFR